MEGAGTRAGGVLIRGWGQAGGGPCMVRSNASWVMVTWDCPVDRMTDTQD